MQSPINHFGRTPVLIVATTETDVYLSEGDIVETSGKESERIEELTETVARIAEGLSRSLSNQKEFLPQEIELECSLSLSQELKMWAIGAAGSQGIKITFKWKR